jgi:HTH-type transcriptional regulator, sugar sensing transcriptional regulator
MNFMRTSLKDIGFTDNDVTIYLTLLKTGPLNTYTLAEKTNMNRGYLYEILKKLNQKGIVVEKSREGKKVYQAVDPDHLITLLKYKLENIESLVPKLKSVQATWAEETKIDVFRGPSCYRHLLHDIMNSTQRGDEVLIFGIDDQQLMKLEPIYLKRYFTLLQKNNITERVIVQRGTKKLAEAKTSKYRFISKTYVGKVFTQIYANKVATLTLTEPLNLIIIEDKDVTETQRVHFEVFWNLAE